MRITRITVIACLSLALTVTSCLSKSRSQDRARKAFLEGRKTGAAAATQQLQQPQATVVTVLGEVRNPVIPWTPGLTLAQAIAQAQHLGRRTPRAVVLSHGEESATLHPDFVLQNGATIQLEPGDVIELVR